MLYEDLVVDAVRGHLELHGWTIERYAHSNEHGDDITAVRGDVRMVVEAKGEGSSKSHTSRYGQPFTKQQVSKHIANAVFRAIRTHPAKTDTAIALPSTTMHRIQIDEVRPALRRLEILVFWVHQGTEPDSNVWVTVDSDD